MPWKMRHYAMIRWRADLVERATLSTSPCEPVLDSSAAAHHSSTAKVNMQLRDCCQAQQFRQLYATQRTSCAVQHAPGELTGRMAIFPGTFKAAIGGHGVKQVLHMQGFFSSFCCLTRQLQVKKHEVIRLM